MDLAWRPPACASTPATSSSLVLAGIGVAAGAEPQLGPLVAAYVLLCILAGTALSRAAP